MVEMGKCIGRCKNSQKCFFVQDYFMCGHLMCYNLAIKFLCCIQCGDRRFRYHMNGNREEVVMSNNILDKKRECWGVRLRVPPLVFLQFWRDEGGHDDVEVGAGPLPRFLHVLVVRAQVHFGVDEPVDAAAHVAAAGVHVAV